MAGSASSARSTDETDVALGQRIRDRRLTIDMTQAGLGEAAGVTFQQVQKYERGVNRVSAARLRKIADALGMTVSALIGEAEPDPIQAPDRLTVALLGAFGQLDDPDLRKQVVGLVEAMVRSRGGPVKSNGTNGAAIDGGNRLAASVARL